MIPYFEWKTISLGPLTLQVWGLFVALGMLLSVVIVTRRGRRLGINTDMLFNLAFVMIISGLIFSRLFHVLFYEPAWYLRHPLEILKIWHGGLSSFGGLFGAGVAFWYYLKKHRLSSQFFPIADLMSFGAVFGWIAGRVGCFMIHDHWGAHSNCPLAIKAPDGARLEMALLEILGMIPLGLLFLFIRKKQKSTGWYTGVLFLYYGILRFILDFWRATDIINADARYLRLTPAQYFAILLALYGGYLLFKIKKGRFA